MAALTLEQSTMTIVRTSVTTVLLAALSWLIFHLVGQRRNVVDFLIATEGEMKKVNWSSRKEVFGATKVVIVTVLALGIMLFLVDVLFILFFVAIKVLRIDILSGLFGRGQ
ncbi:MAG: preprotein translocase subunit SecE [Phycisphaerales bacterium]|nr:preprotein translocase subunit SecE [Phycisphaerales bacterium]